MYSISRTSPFCLSLPFFPFLPLLIPTVFYSKLSTHAFVSKELPSCGAADDLSFENLTYFMTHELSLIETCYLLPICRQFSSIVFHHIASYFPVTYLMLIASITSLKDTITFVFFQFPSNFSVL